MENGRFSCSGSKFKCCKVINQYYFKVPSIPRDFFILARMEILFAKPFQKLLTPDGHDAIKTATLLAVLKISDKSQLSTSFIEYDTDMDYHIEDNIPLLMLMFLKPSNNESKNVFVTIRNWTDEKEKFYQTQIGNNFSVVIENN